jgi:hypothetical protein
MKKLNSIIIFFIITFLGTISLWILDILGIVKNVLLSDFTQPQYFGYLAGDLFAMPLLLVSIIGLYRMKFWGYVATQIEMGAWIYTSVASLVAAVLKGFDDIFALMWSPIYLLVAMYVVFYTWKMRDQFA